MNKLKTHQNMRTLICCFIFCLTIVWSSWAQIDVTTDNSIAIGTNVSAGFKVNVLNDLKANTLRLETTYNSGTTPQFGIRNTINSPSIGHKYGIHTEVTQNDDGASKLHRGVSLTMNLNGVSLAGHYNGGLTSVVNTTNTASGSVYGLVSLQRGVGNATRYGIHSHINSEGSGPRRGIYVVTYQGTNSSLTRGIDNQTLLYGTTPSGQARNHTGFHNWTRLASSSQGDKVGFYNFTEGKGTSGTRYSIFNILTGGGSGGKRYGIYNEVQGSNSSESRYGIYNTLLPDNQTGSRYCTFNIMGVSSTTTTNNFGYYNSVGGPSSKGYITGIFNRVWSGSAKTVYGIRTEIRGSNTGTNYGVHSKDYTTGGAPSYAGYFDGAVVLTMGYTLGSDIKLKDQIVSLPSQLDLVKQLRPVSYFLKADHTATQRMGFIAQEVQEIIPSVVRPVIQPGELIYDEDGNSVVGEEQSEEFLSLDYVELIPVLTKAIQEQQAEIELLKQRLTELED